MRDRSTSHEPDDDKGPWRKVLWAMVGIQFMMSLANSVISPILPVFLPDLGITDRSQVEFWSGVLTSCSFLIAAFASPIWGRFGDRGSRKLMVMRSSSAICVFTALMGLTQNVWQLFALRSLMGAFSGFSAAAVALVATQAPGRKLGMALGWLATGQLVGSLMGPIFGGALADWTGSHRVVFYWTSILAGMAVAAVWFAVPESPKPATTTKQASFRESVKMLTRLPGLLPLLAVLVLAQFGARSVQPVVTLFVHDLVGNQANLMTLAGVAFSITGLADLIASPFLGKRSDVIGYRRVLLISLLGAGFMTLPQAFVHSYWAFAAERFGVGIFIGGILPTANALVGRLTPASDRGLVYGLTASATFLGSFLGPMSGGSIASLFGTRWVFAVTAAVMFLTWVWVYLRVFDPSDRQPADGKKSTE